MSDWTAVAGAIQARLDELGMTQADLALRAGVAAETVRELRTNLRPRRRSPRTLGAISEALDWPFGHLAAVARGAAPANANAGPEELTTIAAELASVADRLNEIAGRLSRIDRK